MPGCEWPPRLELLPPAIPPVESSKPHPVGSRSPLLDAFLQKFGGKRRHALGLGLGLGLFNLLCAPGQQPHPGLCAAR